MTEWSLGCFTLCLDSDFRAFPHSLSKIQETHSPDCILNHIQFMYMNPRTIKCYKLYVTETALK